MLPSTERELGPSEISVRCTGWKRSTSRALPEATEVIMFETAKAFGSFAVDDLAAAQKVYGETLGLRVPEEGGGALMLFLADDHCILVYPKPDHSPASFTISTSPWTISTRPLTS